MYWYPYAVFTAEQACRRHFSVNNDTFSVFHKIIEHRKCSTIFWVCGLPDVVIADAKGSSQVEAQEGIIAGAIYSIPLIPIGYDNRHSSIQIVFVYVLVSPSPAYGWKGLLQALIFWTSVLFLFLQKCRMLSKTENVERCQNIIDPPNIISAWY